MKQLIFRNIYKFKKKTALISNNKSYDYQHLINIYLEFKKKIKSRELVLVVAENSYEFMAGYVALSLNKMVLQLTSYDTGKENILNIINTFKPKYIFIKKDYILKLNKFNKIISFGSYQLLQNINHKRRKISPDLFLLLSTSGSTGSVKYVKLSYKNIESNTKSIIKYMNLSKKNITITTMNPSYSYGLSVINTHLYAGGKIIINNNSIFNKNFWDDFINYKVNTIGGVPFFFEMLKKIKFKKMNLKYLKVLHQAGGKMRKDLINSFFNLSKKNKINFYLMYGQTEASPRIAFHIVKNEIKNEGCIGRPLSGVKILIKKNNRIINDKKKLGELVVKGPNVFIGYAKNYNDLYENKKINQLYTGDTGYLDIDNNFYIVSRLNRIVKLYGQRLNLDEIETVLNKIFTQKFACISIIDDQVYIYGVIEKNTDIIKKLSKKMNLNSKFFIYIQVKEIPRKYNGKVDYETLRNMIKNV